MTECPKLNSFTKNPDIIFVHNQDAIRLSTYDQTVGTKVTVSCVTGRELVAEKPIVTCLATGQWDFTTTPACIDPNKQPSLSGLTEEQTLIVAIVAGIGGLIFIVLLLLVAAICRMQLKAKKKKKDEMRTQNRRDVLPGRPALDYEAFGLDRPYPYSPPYPPSYSSHDKNLDKSTRGGRGPIALPPAPSGHSVYSNPVYNASSMERQFAEPPREDVIALIARERMMQARDEQDKYQTASQVQPDYALFKEDRSRGDGRLPSRGLDNDGFTLNDRDHSHQVNTYDVRRVADEPRYDERGRAGGYHDDRGRAGGYHDDRGRAGGHDDRGRSGGHHEDRGRAGGHHGDRGRAGGQYGDQYEESKRREKRGHSNKHQTAKTRVARTHQYVEDHSDMTPSPTFERRTYDRTGLGRYENAGPISRYEGQSYLTDPTMYNQGHPSGYGDAGLGDLNHWRPDTKPHLSGNRR